MMREVIISLAAGVLAISAIPSPLGAEEVTSTFGTRSDPFHGRRTSHKGVDIAAPTGTPVYATANGMVDHAGRLGSYGLLVKIKHPSGHETRFAHLSKIAVRRGQVVLKGDLIGLVGSTGRSTGPHLHYEVRLRGKALDPATFM